MQSTTQIQRQWQILICLMSRQNGMTIKELSKEAGVDERTIHRDLKSLRKANFQLEERVSDYGRKHWKLVDGGSQIPIQFNWSEAVALYLGRRLLDPLAGTHFWHSAHTAFGKIRAVLGEAALLQLDKVSRSFAQTMPGISDYSSKADLIDRLMIAVEDHKIAFVAYQSERATEPVTLELYPYGIVFHRGSLYLIAYSRDHETRSKPATDKGGLAPSPLGACPPFSPSPPVPGDESANSLRHFKIDRVTDVDVTTLQFSLDPGFQLQKHLANSFGIFQGDDRPDHLQKIRIRFSKEAARYVQEKTWHPSQTLTREKDGSVVLEVSLNNTNQILDPQLRPPGHSPGTGITAK